MATIGTAVQTLQNLGIFTYVIPFLLALAVTYGILEQFGVPKDKSVRGLLAILVGFMTLPLTPVIFPFLEGLTMGMIAVVAAVLILIIMAEMSGIKAAGGKHIWELHPKWTGAVFILIALIIFVQAKGLDLLGIRNIQFGSTVTLIFFLAILALGVWWMATDKK